MHVLIHQQIGDKFVNMCECGQFFGSFPCNVREQCIGDLLASHRNHVRCSIGLAQKLSFDFLSICPTRALIQRAVDVEIRLALNKQ